MTDLELFDQLIECSCSMEMSGWDLIRRARLMEDCTHRRFDLTFCQRDPGFPCWQIDDVPGWFNTAREAVEAKARAKK